MKKLFTTSLFASLLSLSVFATDYTVEPTTAIKSNTIPIFRSSSSMRGSITQQIYLPSEFTPSGASAGNITAVTFYYAAKDANSVNEFSRSIEIWLSETEVNAYSLDKVSTTYNSKFLPKGTKVFDGNLVTEGGITDSDGAKTLKLTFNVTQFPWDGSSNIVLTLYDKSTTNVGDNAYNYLKFYITATDHARFVHQQWVYSTYSFTDDREAWMANLHERYGFAFGSGVSDSIGYANKRNYIPKTTFTIVTPIPAPENLSASSITTSSARLSWDAVTDATSYNVRWGTTSGSLSESAEGVTNTYLDIDELEDGTTYYFDVQAVTEDGESAFASEVSFETTAITHEHNGITFSKWSFTNSLPTSGNYYLKEDVLFTLDNPDVTLTGDLNLCLNGKTATLGINRIIVPNGKTLTIYDSEGDGKITSFYPGSNGAILSSGLITIQEGGTLILHEGEIENTYVTDEDGVSIAICNQGTLQLSGAPKLTSGTIDIFLATGKIITIDGILSTLEPYSVYKELTGDFTSGWSTYMSTTDPCLYFTTVKSGQGVCLNGSESRIVSAFSFDGTVNNNSTISSNSGQLVNVTLANRDITSASYNTLCLPFALTDDQLQSVFGSGYDLEEFTGSYVNGEELDLSFSKVTSSPFLTAGKPYLIRPSEDVSNPTFTGVTISATSPVDQTSDTYVSFHGVFAPTELAANNRNLLFLGAANTLFWPNETAPIYGFRAYFEIKGSAAQAAKRARIVNRTDEPTAIDQTAATAQPAKRLVNGQLLIDFNGKTYNAQGILIK